MVSGDCTTSVLASGRLWSWSRSGARLACALPALAVLLCALLALSAPVGATDSVSESNVSGAGTAIVCHRTSRPGVVECFVEREMREFENKELELVTPMDAIWWQDLGIVIVCVLVAGLMSGLTIGLMGIDQTTLDILARSGTADQRRKAKRLVPLLRQHHWLLVTLLLCNAAAMEALPVFLEHLVPPVAAVALSVTLVLLFGEIIPQAICNRYALSVGYYTAYLVWALIVVTAAVSWPIAKLLDAVLGTGHATFYRRQELRELVAMHAASADAGHGRGADALSSGEVSLLRATLELHAIPVSAVSTPLEDATMLALDARLDDHATLRRLADRGHARIPVYRQHRANVLGYVTLAEILRASNSARNAAEAAPRLAALELHALPRLSASASLSAALSVLAASKLALVVDEQRAVAIVAAADVLHALLRPGHARTRAADAASSADHAHDAHALPELTQVYFNSDDEDEDEDSDANTPAPSESKKHKKGRDGDDEALVRLDNST